MENEEQKTLASASASAAERDYGTTRKGDDSALSAAVDAFLSN